MELIRYRPGEAIRWLQTGAENNRKTASAKGKAVVRPPEEEHKFQQTVKAAAGAVIDFGKGAYTDLLHRQAEASEYILQEKHFDVVHGSTIKSIAYDRVKGISLLGEKATVTLDKGSLTIKPFAHIVAGRIKVPVGWSRNGMEVPYEVLLEELAARCRVELSED